MYKNIIFDVGGVLFDYHWIDVIAMTGISYEEALELGPKLFESPLWQELDLGIRPYFEVVEELANANPGYEENVKEFLTKVERMPEGRPKVWEEVKRLKKAGYKLYILSNYSEYMFSIHTKDKPFIKEMDGLMVSYMPHICKPDRGIYEALIAKYGLNPAECLFFDDRKENVEGAIACGIDAVEITSEEVLLNEMAKL